jgi:putative sigma-54 modulation protein
MNVRIQSVHFSADSKLIDFVNKKLEKLTVFSDRIIDVSVIMKLENLAQNIKDKVVEIKVHVPKTDFFAKSSSKSFEESFDQAYNSLLNQVKRQKEKQAA